MNHVAGILDACGQDINLNQGAIDLLTPNQ